jgi:hypothetical protein
MITLPDMNIGYVIAIVIFSMIFVIWAYKTK